MSRDRTPPAERVYAIIRTRNSVVRRRLGQGPKPWDDDIIETVRGSEKAWIALACHRVDLGFGEGWFVSRDDRGTWRMYDARKHPVPQHVPPSHRGLAYNDAETLVMHEEDNRPKRGPRGGRRETRTVKMRDTLLGVNFEVPERDVEKWLTRKGIVRA